MKIAAITKGKNIEKLQFFMNLKKASKSKTLKAFFQRRVVLQLSNRFTTDLGWINTYFIIYLLSNRLCEGHVYKLSLLSRST